MIFNVCLTYGLLKARWGIKGQHLGIKSLPILKKIKYSEKNIWFLEYYSEIDHHSSLRLQETRKKIIQETPKKIRNKMPQPCFPFTVKVTTASYSNLPVISYTNV